jgi:hypothetical protein
MTSILFALAVVALVVYGLERNHHRQFRLGSRLAGSSEVEDRDVPRMQADLHATTSHDTQPTHDTQPQRRPQPHVTVARRPASLQQVNLPRSDQRCLAQ